MTFNLDRPNNQLKSIYDGAINQVQNFKYLGRWVESSEKDIAYKKAWSACHRLRTVWSSSLSSIIKVRLFQSTVESVLMYNSSTWTLTKRMEISLNDTYTRMLRMIKGVSWKVHMSNHELYCDLPKITHKIAVRRMRLGGHCLRHPEEIASQLVVLQPTKGRIKRGRKPTRYIENIKRDTGLRSIKYITVATMDRSFWIRYVREARSPE